MRIWDKYGIPDWFTKHIHRMFGPLWRKNPDAWIGYLRVRLKKVVEQTLKTTFAILLHCYSMKALGEERLGKYAMHLIMNLNKEHAHILTHLGFRLKQKHLIDAKSNSPAFLKYSKYNKAIYIMYAKCCISFKIRDIIISCFIPYSIHFYPKATGTWCLLKIRPLVLPFQHVSFYVGQQASHTPWTNHPSALKRSTPKLIIKRLS